jgi:hypothetical protein
MILTKKTSTYMHLNDYTLVKQNLITYDDSKTKGKYIL